MPRRHKLTRQNLDFTIHEDGATGMESDSDVRDFAHDAGMQPETPNEIPHNAATDSSMTKASTLVNEDAAVPQEPDRKDGLEERLDNMLEELKGEIRGAERLVEGGRRDSWDVGGDEIDVVSRRESGATHDDQTESSSRRESILTIEPRDAPTEGSFSRRESAISTATYDDDYTQDSGSRRESALSNASWSSDRRKSYHEDDSILSHDVDNSIHDNDRSILDNGTQASSSRRESTYEDTEASILSDEQSSQAPEPTNRRASERTEALIHAAAMGIVEQLGQSAQSSRSGERTEGSARASDAQTSVMDQSDVQSSVSYQAPTVESEDSSKVSSARPSVAYEPLLEEKSARPSAAHESVVEEAEEEEPSKIPSARSSAAHGSQSKQTSARPSAAHDSIVDVEENQSRVSSARPSEAHESVVAEEESHSMVSSARPSAAHESVVIEEEEGENPSKIPSVRSSAAHESVVAEEEAPLRVSSARPSAAHESIAAEEEDHSRVSSARPSATHESVVAEESLSEVPSARPSEAHEAVVAEEEEDQSRAPIARPFEAHEAVPEETVVQSIEEDEQPVAMDEEAGTSSHNENDDDVFSDHSPRSSVGSLSGEDHTQRKLSHDKITQRTSMRSARMSEFSHYDTDDQEEAFIPTVRGTPRPPFRSPSSVKAMQMSSPPASVIGSGRSSRRTPLPTVSRLGSPSAQYSPKKTPPRFKRNTPPLVLLHVTLLPLRWPWGDVLDVAQMDELSESGKGLKEGWRQLQERMGDTTCERGILLPHPQNDFEVLEERLLEALELPLRRRARILECGHYLGPSNDLSLLDDDSESEDEDYYHASPRQSRSSANKETHWCGTCHSEIRYDSLGLGKVFRVKVYASNGLIKAGAWEACWKEMERVDVEIEPIVETEVHDELVRLDSEQQRALELIQEEAQRLEDEEVYAEEQCVEEEEEEPSQLHHDIPPSSPPEIRVTSAPSPPTADEERRLHDEARLREIYGHPPPAASDPTPVEQPPSSEYTHHQSPPSPSAEAYARREERRQSTPRHESLPTLILEAVRVMMQDRKNVVIALMSVLVLALALRSGGGVGQGPADFQPIVKQEPPSVVTRAQDTVSSVVESIAPTVESVMSSASEAMDPCSTAASQGYQHAVAEQETVVSERIVTVVETLTETSYETATIMASAPEETVADEPAAVGEDSFEKVEDAVEDVQPTIAVVEEIVLEEVVPQPEEMVEEL